MGLLSSFGGGSGGDSKKAIQRALAATREARDKAVGHLGTSYKGANQYLQQGTEQGAGYFQQGAQDASNEMRLGNQQAYGILDPAAQAGMGALNNLYASATPEGYAANIQNLSQGGVFDPLVAQNRRTLQSELAAQGLTRSGSGMSQMSQIPLNTLMGIEGSLSNRLVNTAQLGLPSLSAQAQMAMNTGTGLSNIASGLGTNLGNLYAQQGSNLANLQSQYGQNLANVELGQGTNEQAAHLGTQQAQAAGQQGNQQMLGSVLGFLGSDTGGDMMSGIGSMF